MNVHISHLRRLLSLATQALGRPASNGAGTSGDSTTLRVARGTLWAFIGTAGSQSLALLVAVVLGRALGQVGFGEYGVIVGTVGTLGVFSGIGLGKTATRHVAELRGRDPARAGRILMLCRWAATFSGGAVAIGIAVAAPYLASRVLNAPTLAADLRIGCGLLFFNTLAGVQAGGLAGFEAFPTLAGLAALRGAVSLGLVAIGVYTYGLRGALVALVVASAVGFVLSERALSARCSRDGIPYGFRPHLPVREWPVLWSFSLPAFLSGAMVTPVTWLGSVLVVNQPGGYPAIGLFNAAAQWRQVLLFMPTVVGQAFVPILSNQFGEGNLAGFKKVLVLNFLLVAASTCVLAAPMLILPRQLMAMFGKGFSGGEAILQLLCVATVLAAIAGVGGNSITSMGKMWHGFWLNILWAATFVTCSLWFAKDLALGLARAYVVTYCVHAASVVLYVLVMTGKLNPRPASGNRVQGAPAASCGIGSGRS